MNLIGPAILAGLVLSGLYGLLAAGIVITYNTSRVINFAQGAIAAFAVFTLHALLGHHVPYVAGLVIAVGVGAGLGYLIAKTTLIPMRGESPLNRTITTIGWLLALQGAAALLFSADQSTNIPPLLSNGQLFGLFGLGVSSQALLIVVVAAGIALALGLFFTRSNAGVVMRAASHNPQAVELLGSNANNITALSYAIAGALAGLAGVLVAPELGAIDASTLTLFIIQSLAAALIGGLRSLHRAAIGALVLGVVQSMVSIIPIAEKIPGLKFTVAFIFIVLALVMWPDTGRDTVQRGVATVRTVAASGRVRRGLRLAGIIALGGFLLIEGFAGGSGSGIFGDYNRFQWAEVFADAVVFLSITLLVGFIGQISLCQVTFAGFGAFFAAIFTTDVGLPFPAALALAALCCAPIGALIGIPALRIRGLQLAVVTLAFAVVADQLFFAQSFPLSGGPSGRTINGSFGPINLISDSTNRQMYWMFLGIFAVLAAMLVLFKRSPSGRSFAAVRDSEVAASAMGVSVTRMKLTAFAISAAIAGLGGGLFALTLGTVSSPSFNPSFSIQYLALALLAGVRSIAGALIAATLLVWGPVSTTAVMQGFGFDPAAANNLTLLLSGVLLVGVLRVSGNGLVGIASRLGQRIADVEPAVIALVGRRRASEQRVT